MTIDSHNSVPGWYPDYERAGLRRHVELTDDLLGRVGAKRAPMLATPSLAEQGPTIELPGVHFAPDAVGQVVDLGGGLTVRPATQGTSLPLTRDGVTRPWVVVGDAGNGVLELASRDGSHVVRTTATSAELVRAAPHLVPGARFSVPANGGSASRELVVADDIVDSAYSPDAAMPRTVADAIEGSVDLMPGGDFTTQSWSTVVDADPALDGVRFHAIAPRSGQDGLNLAWLAGARSATRDALIGGQSGLLAAVDGRDRAAGTDAARVDTAVLDAIDWYSSRFGEHVGTWNGPQINVASMATMESNGNMMVFPDTGQVLAGPFDARMQKLHADDGSSAIAAHMQTIDDGLESVVTHEMGHTLLFRLWGEAATTGIRAVDVESAMLHEAIPDVLASVRLGAPNRVRVAFDGSASPQNVADFRAAAEWGTVDSHATAAVTRPFEAWAKQFGWHDTGDIVVGAARHLGAQLARGEVDVPLIDDFFRASLHTAAMRWGVESSQATTLLRLLEHA